MHDDGAFMPEGLRAPEDLDHLSKAQLIALLCSDHPDKIDLWNQWRLRGGTTDLIEVRLAGAMLRGINLHLIQLQGADLAGADLSGADLQFCDLTHAYMSRATLVRADLQSAQMAGAHLFHADLREAILIDTNLDDANLHAADLSGAHLRGASLREASLVQANLRGASLRQANVQHADLAGADLSGANLTRVLLEHANLPDVNLEGAILHLAVLRDVFLINVTSLKGVRLYQTNFWGAMGVPYEMFLDEQGRSTIWEETQGRFNEAVDVYKSLKGFYEDAGDYEAANWAFLSEQIMKKLMCAPVWARWLYPEWRSVPRSQIDPHCRTSIWKWLGLEIAEQLAGYGQSLVRPLLWVLLILFSFAWVYSAGGMLTAIPGCGYEDLRLLPHDNCVATYNYLDGLRFSLAALTTMEVGGVKPYVSYVEILASIEALLGIALTGLFGFVLGNKLRNS